jgi:phosphoenolpyruvate synthase/pyruvate phosphate dikinase
LTIHGELLLQFNPWFLAIWETNAVQVLLCTRGTFTGEKDILGEYLVNAQGEDVVAGIRTPQQITIKGSQKWAKETNIRKGKKGKVSLSGRVYAKAFQQLVECIT